MTTVEPMRLIIAGTLPPPICGTTVSLRHLIDDIADRHQDVRLTVIETGGIRGRGIFGVVQLCRILVRFLALAPSNDVVALHLNPYAIPWLGTYLVGVCRLFRLRLVIRLFGGNCFSEYGGVRGYFFRFAIRNCDVYLAQTHSMVAAAKREGIEHAQWFPTSRPVALQTERRRNLSCRRFVYAGWVSRTKGMLELIEAGRKLTGSGITIDVFGTFAEGVQVSDFDGQDVVRYQGVLKPRTVGQKLCEYDALVFPSHYIGEGYPGVIIEAFHAGLPVIATRWRHIPELVDDTCGLLIEPGNVNDLKAAIDTLSTDTERYERLQTGAAAQSLRFSMTTWTDKFLGYCRTSQRPRHDSTNNRPQSSRPHHGATN